MEYKLIKIVDKINHFILTFTTPSGIKSKILQSCFSGSL